MLLRFVAAADDSADMLRDVGGGGGPAAAVVRADVANGVALAKCITGACDAFRRVHQRARNRICLMPRFDAGEGEEKYR